MTTCQIYAARKQPVQLISWFPHCAFRDASLQGQKTGIVTVGVLEGAPFDVFNLALRSGRGRVPPSAGDVLARKSIVP